MTLHAASLERLLEGQATADAEERPPPVVPSGGRDRSGQLAEGETRSQRRWLPWRFARPGTSAAAEAQGPSPSAHTGVLFGRPLAALCSQDGALPQPIQDLLALLHEQGPSTEGIFRLAASERASRDIREALDTGAQVHLASQPVHVLAGPSPAHQCPPLSALQDLLALLHEQGPSTEGIFRLAASERASRDIREALDTGAQVHLASQPVHVLAVILKDFLRKIPSKLLHSELYQQWMDALQKTSRQERLAGLKEVAGKLPEANLLLLRTLLSLLHKISTNVPVTKMTARNLAICVGPNLLSPPEEDTLALDVLMQVTGKVSELVEFLIQHHEELFEEQEEEEEAEIPGAPAEAELASQQAEESPAPEEEGETAEVPPVPHECEPQESTSGQNRCPSSSQQGETPSPRKRKHSCEEEAGGPPPKRCRKL
nr:T-cell activation Rho GTPase-activating protein [Columba livia]